MVGAGFVRVDFVGSAVSLVAIVATRFLHGLLRTISVLSAAATLAARLSRLFSSPLKLSLPFNSSTDISTTLAVSMKFELKH